MTNTHRPNILWVCTDQQRFDTIAALGNAAIRTPNIDLLVRQGVSFLQAFCQSPVCTPSRASFLTGRYPRTTRCRQNGQAIPPYERLLSRLFADAGYTCGLAGKLHLAACAGGQVERRIDDGYTTFHWSHHPPPDWPENGYTQWLTERGQDWDALYSGPQFDYIKQGVAAEFHQTTWCADMAIDFIRANQGRPWLFSFNCFDPHHPFDPPQEYLSRYDPADMPLPKRGPLDPAGKTSFQQLDHEWAHNEPGYFHSAAMSEHDIRQVTAAYYAMIELIDDQVGRMLAALDQTGQRDDTIVVFMSDHGEMLGDHGIFLKGPHFYEAAVRVPLVIAWPERFEANLRSSALVELVDLAPSLLDVAGLPVPEAMQGKSLAGILRGTTDPHEHREYVYSEYYNAWTHRHAYGTMLRTRHEKVVVYHGTREGELYDLARDPDEFDNLWAKPERRDDKLRLVEQAFDASIWTLDPLPPRTGPF